MESPFDSGNHRGWIGSQEQLFRVLKALHCDTVDGQFCVDGDISSFMGAGDEFVVGENAVFYVEGAPHSLAHALRTSGGGIGVTVL